MKTLWVAALAAVVGCGAGKSVTVVDRLEEGRAVLVTERGEEVPAAAAELPAGTREGDVLVTPALSATAGWRRSEPSTSAVPMRWPATFMTSSERPRTAKYPSWSRTAMSPQE